MTDPPLTWPLTAKLEIEWRDSHTRGSWASPENYREHQLVGPCRSIGYVLDHEGDVVTLLQNLSAASGNVADSITIPKECILRQARVTGGLSDARTQVSGTFPELTKKTPTGKPKKGKR